MRTFYSILYAVIRPQTDEKIALGLILSDSNNSYFDYSKNKLNAVKSLLDNESIKFIQNYISAIKKTVHKSLMDLNQHSIFEIIDKKHPIINDNYFNYLSIYSTNIVWFSKTLQIDIPVNQDNFSKLFEKMVDEDYGKVIPISEIQGVRRVRHEFIPKVAEFFSHDTTVSGEDFSGLITPVSIDLIGRNERMVFAQFLDMERTIRDIKYGFYDIKELKEVEKNSIGFIVSEEPEKERFGKQHLIWDNIRKYPQCNYLDVSEVEKIKEYAELHQVVPYFSS